MYTSDERTETLIKLHNEPAVNTNKANFRSFFQDASSTSITLYQKYVDRQTLQQ